MATKREAQNSIFTVREAAEALGISPATLKNWIKLGKISADTKGSTYVLSKRNLEACAKALESGDLLRRRRNKMLSDTNFIPRSYIDSASPNYKTIIAIAEAFGTSDVPIEDVLSYYAISIMKKSGLSSESIDRLAIKPSSPRQDLGAPVYAFELEPVMLEDTLGMLYLSLRGLRSKKATGSYYTPFYVVDEICRSSLFEASDKSPAICDPACGTGNFLIHLPGSISFKDICGYDIDPIAVSIARINVALKHKADDSNSLDIICNNIRTADFLSDDTGKQFDVIIGNPPWGYGYSPAEADALKNNYRCASGTGRPESFSLFIEKAMTVSREVSFLIPETFLESDAHRSIREFILENGALRRLSYLGEIFDKVQCPCIILNISKGSHEADVQVSFFKRKKKSLMEVRSFAASRDRLSPRSFQLICDDIRYSIIRKMDNSSHFCLKDNADFALGIVTGDNRHLLSPTKDSGSEGIIKGTDIEKFQLKKPSSFVRFSPDLFQQVAPEELYRNKDKLFYRFIAPEPVVAADEEGYISLNSANILIPRAEGYSSCYIMAVLNSSSISFYYRNTCRNMKVLRARLETLPIPCCDKDVIRRIEELTAKITTSKETSSDIRSLRFTDELNLEIAKLFGLTNEEIQVISND